MLFHKQTQRQVQLQKQGRSQELYLILKTQFAEYQQQFFLNVGFILSLAIATSTLLSILILNHASKEEYKQANAKLNSPIAYYIVPKIGNVVSISDFAKLRKQGFIALSPVLSFQKTLANERKMSFRAIDLLPLSLSQPKEYNSDFLMVSSSYAKSLMINIKQPLVLKNNIKQDNINKNIKSINKNEIKLKINDHSNFGEVAVLDIQTAWQLFDDLHDFSYLVVNELSNEQLERLEQALPSHLVLQQSWSLDERSGFADALHLNLIALALLAFVVSIFIAYQAANQAWHKRSGLMAQLRMLGVSLSNIRISLSLEALFLIFSASIIGILIAIVLVSFLLPILGLTLQQLYNLQSSGHLTWKWEYLYWSLSISSISVFLALLKQFTLINNRKISLFAKQIKTNTTDIQFFRKTFFIGMISLLLFFVLPEIDWHHIMIKYALLLLVGIACLPLFLKIILNLLTKLIDQFQLKFILQDVINQISRRFLPLAAFYIALTTSIAAALMVNSFESAFVKYLTQNLNEDLYIRFKASEKQALVHWLEEKEEVEQYYLYYKGIAKINNETIVIKTIGSIKEFNSIVLKSSSIKHFDQLSELGCFINEQIALKRNITLDNRVEFNQNQHKFKCVVKGIYYDYGNPGFEITLTTAVALKQLNALTEIGFGIYLNQNPQGIKPDIQQALIDELTLDNNQIFKPENIKKMALSIFSQTFLLTKSIAAVLLSIACFGLFLSANNLEMARKNDLFVLFSLGYSRLALFTHMFSQWLLLAVGCMVLSWPIAILIANALVTKIFPASFGWSMPLVLDFSSFSTSSFIGLLCLFPALILPLRKILVTKEALQ